MPCSLAIRLGLHRSELPTDARERGRNGRRKRAKVASRRGAQQCTRYILHRQRKRERERMLGGGDGTERARKKAIRYHGCANEIKEMNPGEREDRRRLRV